MAVAMEQVTINGKAEQVPSGLTVADLLTKRGIHTTLVAVEVNGRILNKEEFPTLELRGGDKIEVVHFVGGG